MLLAATKSPAFLLGLLLFLLVTVSLTYRAELLDAAPQSLQTLWQSHTQEEATLDSPTDGPESVDPVSSPLAFDKGPAAAVTDEDAPVSVLPTSGLPEAILPDAGAPDEQKVEDASLEALLTEDQLKASLDNMAIEHLNLTSNMTSDGNYFLIEFGNLKSYNPNVIPHPYREETYIIVAQRDKRTDDNRSWNTELVCEARFTDSALRCVTAPMSLPIITSVSTHCEGKLLDLFSHQMGPHDARVFYGPSTPFIIYGSQATHTCFGQWIQDLRRVVDFGRLIPQIVDSPNQTFTYTQELQRPAPYGLVEKNWFAFWDLEGSMYLHYDLTPHRVFAKVDPSFDGSVGENLAPLAVDDDACLARHLPQLKPTGLEWLHQSTPSLAITLCKRSDPACRQSADNTFIFTIIQHKTFYFHGIYEPYVLLFSASPPFGVFGISSKPFWIPGRGQPNGTWSAEKMLDPAADRTWVPKHQSQMVFVVSMAWRSAEQTYHGFLDDELFVTFGVEDSASGGIIVTAGDLIDELNLCAQD